VRPNILIPILLVATTLGVYGQVYRHEFITYDDYSYIKNNFDVQQGLTGESIHWAFTTHHQANWHPLTWLSHMADYNLFGLNAGYHHLESALMHLAAALLLYAALVWMTRAPWRSGLVAALFALHPLHVESVAWASERKDVLSGLLAMLVILAYVGYARRTTWQRMGLVMVLLALGLLAKPMLVTLPFALLLLDYWPLGRFNANRPEPDAEASSRALWPTAARLVLEKLPLFALAAASCVITMEVQKSAMAGPWAVSLPHRLANAAVSCVTYLEKMVWPSGLAFFYPYPEEIPAWQWACPALNYSPRKAGIGFPQEPHPPIGSTRLLMSSRPPLPTTTSMFSPTATFRTPCSFRTARRRPRR
jgi:protein O-mannosyl-transferase